MLRPGGLLLIDEFVGPSRMRFDDETLAYANAVRGMLPERILARPRGGLAERRLDRDWFDVRIAKDPSAAMPAGPWRQLPSSSRRPFRGRPVARSTSWR